MPHRSLLRLVAQTKLQPSSSRSIDSSTPPPSWAGAVSAVPPLPAVRLLEQPPPWTQPVPPPLVVAVRARLTEIESELQRHEPQHALRMLNVFGAFLELAKRVDF